MAERQNVEAGPLRPKLDSSELAAGDDHLNRRFVPRLTGPDRQRPIRLRQAGEVRHWQTQTGRGRLRQAGGIPLDRHGSPDRDGSDRRGGPFCEARADKGRFCCQAG